MDKLSFKLLKLYSKRESLSLSDLAVIYNEGLTTFSSPIGYLIDKAYLKSDKSEPGIDGTNYTPNTQIFITYEGRAALAAEKQNRRNIRISEFRAWLTLAIALAAFIKSFFF